MEEVPMRSFVYNLAAVAALSLVLSPSRPATADFSLEPPLVLTPDRTVGMAVSRGGQSVLVAWDDQLGVYFRLSQDGGLSFQPQKQAAAPPPENIDGLWLEFDSGSVPLMAADGGVSRVLASLGLETDPFFPPPGLPPRLHLSFPRLYGSGPATAFFRYTHAVTGLSDYCQGAPGLGCSTLRVLDAAMSADGQQIAVIWNAFGLDGQQGDTWFARAQGSDRTFGAPVNLSELLLPSSAGNDFDPRIVSSGDGNRLFVLWKEIGVSGDSPTNIASSTDGGVSWSLTQLEEVSSDGDLAYTDESGVLHLAYSTGFYFLDPPIEVQIAQSGDDAGTFSPPVTVAVKHVLGDGTQMMPTSPVRVSASDDGRVIAVLHAEEPCDPIFGCLGGSVLPFDVVLSISDDGGFGFQRVGVVAQTHFAQSLSYAYDLHVRGDGDAVYLLSESAQHGATIFRRALRISAAR
jgi:hypothetical protein